VELRHYWNQSFSRPKLRPIYDDWLDKHSNELNNSNDMPIVDLGCGIGNNTLYLLERNYQVVSCDISEVALHKLRTFIPNAVTRQFDMIKGIPFEDSSVRIIIADLSLHYFSEEDTFNLLNDLNRILETHGLLICRLNSVKNLKEDQEYFLEVGGLWRRYFDEDQINYFFDSTHWEIIYMKENIMNRYSTNKVVWEISMRKKHFA
jgi:SAM-dependent methyltransferase